MLETSIQVKNKASSSILNPRKEFLAPSVGKKGSSSKQGVNLSTMSFSTGQNNNDYDSIIMQAQKRKILRRAANRKSAQLSRARKKAHMEDLMKENIRLQKLVDILESQPEILLCITNDGKITYIPEKSLFSLNSLLSRQFLRSNTTHINQIFSNDSTSNILKTVLDIQNGEVISGIKDQKVYFCGSTTQNKLIGLLKCSRVIKTIRNYKLMNDQDDGKVLKSRMNEENLAESVANAVDVLSSLSNFNFNSPNELQQNILMKKRTKSFGSDYDDDSSNDGTDYNNSNPDVEADAEIEFVCVIHVVEKVNPTAGLSTSNMAAHNFSHSVQGQIESKTFDRPMSPNDSLSSSLSSLNNGSDSSRQSNDGSGTNSNQSNTKTCSEGSD